MSRTRRVRGIRTRLVAVSITCVVLTTSCAQVTNTSSTSVPGSDGADTSTSAPRPPGAVDAALAVAWIEVVDIERGGTATSTGRSVINLWTWQVDSMAHEVASGTGYLGSQLDSIVGSPGGVPFSYLVAAWLVNGATPIARSAADLMGDQAWENAPFLTYPSVVLTLFVADAEHALTADTGGEAAGIGASGLRASLAQSSGGVCSTVVNFVNDVLTALFDLFKVDAGDGFLGFLGDIWNTAVDLVQGVITGLVDAITKPVVDAIQAAFFIVGTIAMLASVLSPWQLDVTSSAPNTRFAVGSEPDIGVSFSAAVATGLPSWPAPVVDCAQAAGLELFDPGTAAGSAVKWGVVGFPDLGSPLSSATAIGPDNRADYEWVTGREESDRGEERSDIVAAGVSVSPNRLDSLKAMVYGLINGLIPKLPFAFEADELFGGFIEPIFDELTELMKVQGSTYSTVAFHEEEAPLCIVGTWVSQTFTYPDILYGRDSTGGSGVVVVVDEDGTARWNFNEMVPMVAAADPFKTAFTDRGTATGEYTATEEPGAPSTWTSSRDTSAMTSTIGGAEVPPPLFASYVLLTGGTYTCNETSLVFSTADAEGTPVNVPLARVDTAE